MKLNWRDFFMNENLLTDALKYRDWDHKNLEIPEKETLLKDLTRTRNDDPFFKKESTQKYMMLLATFYCQQNKVNYQQGMLEVVVPFLLLKNKDFPIQKCYSYFNQFMCMYFPKVLEWNVIVILAQLVEGNKELAHVLSAIQFCEILLKYHCADFYNRILRIEEFNISMVVTPLIMTLFAKGTPIQLVFLIFDEYMKRHNQNYIFFMISALFETRKQDILEREDDEELLPYLSRNLKELNTQDDVMQLFSIADTQYSQTPVSYEHLISRTSFHDKSVLSVEDIKELTELGQSYYSKCIFMELNEMRSLLGVSSKKPEKQIQLKVMDIRNTQKPKLKEYIPKKYITKQPNNSHHTCLITDSNETLNQAIKIADELLMKGVKHVSILKGGFANLFNLTKTSKDCCVM